MLFSAYSTEGEGGSHLPDIAPKDITIGSLTVRETVISAVLVTIILLIFAAVVRIFFIPKWKKSNSTGGFRMFIEGLVSMFDKTSSSTIGVNNSSFVGPFYFAVAALICVGTLIELLGLRPPTSDLSLNITLGLCTFFLIHSLGFKEKKAHRLLHYLNPIFTLTDAVLPISMALRLFGSVFSGFLIMHVIYSFIGYVVPAFASVMFTLFHALIQSYIFMILSLNFIAEATEKHEPKKHIKKVKPKKQSEIN